MKKLSIFIITMLTAIVSFGQVAKYSFDNQNTNDDIGNLDATNIDATFNSNTFNGSGYSCQFSGLDNNQIVFIEDSIINLTENFSISFWFNVDSINPYNPMYLVSSRQDSVGNEQGGIDFTIFPGASLSMVGRSAYPFSNVIICNSSSTIIPNQWYLITAVLSNDSIASLYVNAVLEDTDTIPNYFSGNRITTSDFWAFGSVYNYGSTIIRELSGVIDDVRFYDYPLDILEINALYSDLNLGINDGLDVSEKLTLYPSPASNYIIIDKLEQHWENIELLNVKGEVLISQKLNGNKLDVEHIPGGTYFIIIRDGSRRIVAKERFVKE